MEKHKIEFDPGVMQSIDDAVAVPFTSRIERNATFVDVCTFFGTAAYYAQFYEDALASLLTEFTRLAKAMKLEIDPKTGIDNLDRNTLGMLLGKLRVIFEIESDFDMTLQTALKRRNELMHNFFKNKSGDIDNHDKAVVWVRSLVEDGLLFKKATYITWGIRSAVIMQADKAEH